MTTVLGPNLSISAALRLKSGKVPSNEPDVNNKVKDTMMRDVISVQPACRARLPPWNR
jgi:hypothetical protein